MPYAACYSLDLYCRHSTEGYASDNEAFRRELSKHPFNYFPQQYTGETFGQCRKKATKDGWTFNRDGEVTCPYCSGHKKVPKGGFQ